MSTHRDIADEGSTPRRSQRPWVAGVAGGVGATVLAHALEGLDRGVFTGRPVDVLVCRATGDSLHRAARAAYLIAGQGRRRPVLAVNAADATSPSRPSLARMRLLEPHTAAVVVLPYVRRWRDMAVPLDDVTGLLTRPLTELPRPLRRFAAAVKAVAQALDAPPHRPSAPRRPHHLHVVRPAGRSLS